MFVVFHIWHEVELTGVRTTLGSRCCASSPLRAAKARRPTRVAIFAFAHTICPRSFSRFFVLSCLVLRDVSVSHRIQTAGGRRGADFLVLGDDRRGRLRVPRDDVGSYLPFRPLPALVRRAPVPRDSPRRKDNSPSPSPLAGRRRIVGAGSSGCRCYTGVWRSQASAAAAGGGLLLLLARQARCGSLSRGARRRAGRVNGRRE